MDQRNVQKRGSLGFEVDLDGRIVSNAANVDRLRALWLDRGMIDGDLLGPGDPGDFDHGAWHISCHLAGAGGVRRRLDGRLLWLEISHDSPRDRYYASVTHDDGTGLRTRPLNSAEGGLLIRGSTLLGFVEGSSTGNISAASVVDSDVAFNGNPRQEYNRHPDDPEEGGKVWEHWCTLRDIRQSAPIGSSVLEAYVELLSVLGDVFAAVVARGRREYHHPEQLGAMVVAGLISRESALIDVAPLPLPDSLSEGLSMANPHAALASCTRLDWGDTPRYYMFGRKIESWADGSFISDTLNAQRWR